MHYIILLKNKANNSTKISNWNPEIFPKMTEWDFSIATQKLSRISLQNNLTRYSSGRPCEISRDGGNWIPWRLFGCFTAKSLVDWDVDVALALLHLPVQLDDPFLELQYWLSALVFTHLLFPGHRKTTSRIACPTCCSATSSCYF